MTTTAMVVYIAAIATAIAMVSASPDQLVVDTAFGKVRGVDEGTYSAFKGIPYEASTAGEGRWTAPKDPEPWEDVRDATKFGAICPQVPPENDVYVKTISEELGLEGNDNSTYTMDEDCLYLNVYSPNVTGDLPVMVWIHGGTLVSLTSEFQLRRRRRLPALLTCSRDSLFFSLCGKGERSWVAVSRRWTRCRGCGGRDHQLQTGLPWLFRPP